MFGIVTILSIFLLTSSIKAQISESEWRALVEANAAANPHATFSVDGYVPFVSLPTLSHEDQHDSNSAHMPMSQADVKSLVGSLGEDKSIDWRKKGAVTPVKNQGAFGTCWSFAAAENLEGLNVRQGNKLQNVSNQELIDCCATCQGRAADASFDWLMNNTGGHIDTQESYPYKGNVSKCDADGAGKVRSTVKLSTFGRITDDGTGDPIVAGLVKYGPMGLGVDATCFFGYKGGVITNCTKSAIDHAVLMIGAGHDDQVNADYYIIKNSWGAKWGEEGYVRVARGTPKQAGIGSTVWTM